MKTRSLKDVLLVILAVAVALALVFYINKPDRLLHVSFLDVGQGDAVLIQQGGIQILVDGGPSPQILTGELGRLIPFWDRTIELVVLTHPHADHLAGLVEVLRRYKVKQILEPSLFTLSDTEYNLALHNEWQNLIRQKNTRVIYAQTYQQFDIGQIVINILNPSLNSLEGTSSDIDNNSVVLTVKVEDISFLLTGDLMQPGEHDLVMQRLVENCTVLKVGHHGSNTSTCQELLSVVRPRVAIISSGADNVYGFPSDEVMQRLEACPSVDYIYRTDVNGTVEFISDGKNLWLQ